jgi:glycolate oxidase iron-sulfur subunit
MLPSIKDRPLQPGTESWTPKTVAKRAVLFNGCIMGTVFADVNRAAGRVMAHNGIAVDVPVAQQCCGALQVHSGMMAEARDLARRNIEAFEASGQETIVVTAAGCGAALKDYGHLLHDDPEYAERAKEFGRRVKDVNEFLGSEPIVEPPKAVERTVTYQEPCHLAHAQRVAVPPRALLKSIKGVELVEMKESALCCGSAGIYNILRKDFADKLGDRKAMNTIATGATAVVTANPGCYLQLRSTLKRNGGDMDVRYIVELLDEAYGGPDVSEWAIDHSAHRSS